MPIFIGLLESFSRPYNVCGAKKNGVSVERQGVEEKNT